MIDKQVVKSLVEEWLEGKEYFMTDLTVSADDRIVVQAIADGIHLHPDILRIAAKCKGAAGVALISDSMEAAAAKNARIQEAITAAYLG